MKNKKIFKTLSALCAALSYECIKGYGLMNW